MKKVLIGKVIIDKDVEMVNTQFGYAASYERLMVKKGEYPIYTYKNDLNRNGCALGWRNFIGYEGTVIDSNVGGKPGNSTSYDLMIYDYALADHFLDGHSYDDVRKTYELNPEWGIELHDFISCIDNRRVFTKKIVLKDGAELHYMD